jgi:hypothetical protein
LPTALAAFTPSQKVVAAAATPLKAAAAPFKNVTGSITIMGTLRLRTISLQEKAYQKFPYVVGRGLGHRKILWKDCG